LVDQQLATARNWTYIYIIDIYVKIHEVEKSDWLTNYPKYEWILATSLFQHLSKAKHQAVDIEIFSVYIYLILSAYITCVRICMYSISQYICICRLCTHMLNSPSPPIVAETPAITSWWLNLLQNEGHLASLRHIKHCNLGKRGVISKWS
jgi:hypothetical protein